MASQVGQPLPDVTLWENTPGDVVKLREICAEKRCVIVGVPGAFTPTCSESHLPGFLESYDKLMELKIDLVAFVSVVDAFVMAAWGKDQKTDGKIRMWADSQMELTKALDVVLPIASVLGHDRCKRFAMVVENNVIQWFAAEEDSKNVDTTSAEAVLAALNA